MRHWHLLVLLAHSVWPGPSAILLPPGPFLSFMVVIAAAVTYLPCSTNGLSSTARSQRRSPRFGASLPQSYALGRHPHVASCFCLWEWDLFSPFAASFQSLPCWWFPLQQLTPWVTGRARGISRARRWSVGDPRCCAGAQWQMHLWGLAPARGVKRRLGSDCTVYCSAG